MPFGEPVKRLAAQIVLNDLPLKLDRMRALLSHGLSPRKPGSVSRFSGSPSVHPKGCTPECDPLHTESGFDVGLFWLGLLMYDHMRWRLLAALAIAGLSLVALGLKGISLSTGPAEAETAAI